MSKNLFIAGATGFLGKNFITSHKSYKIKCFVKGEKLNIPKNTGTIINFVGKAHDTSKSYDYVEYAKSNILFTKELYDSFLISGAQTLIHISSIKACADFSDIPIFETAIAKPATVYGQTKLEGEKVLLLNDLPSNKRIIVLRPTLIYGAGIKGNLNSLIKWVNFGLPWPFAKIHNKRNLCSINTLFKFIDEVIENDKVPSGIYNVCDTNPLSSSEIISIIEKLLKKKILFIPVPLKIFKLLAKIGNAISYFPINDEKLNKLSSNFLVDNTKMRKILGASFKENILQDFEEMILQNINNE